MKDPNPYEIKQALEGVRWMSYQQGERVMQIIKANRLTRALEIGTMHGVGTCLMASAVGDGGTVTTVDIKSPEPDVLECADRCGIPRERIEKIVDPLGSSWVLYKMHKEKREFDFVYIDGRHVIENILCDFFQSFEILKPGGWMMFDDLDWSHDSSPDTGSPQREKWMSKFPQEWRDLFHVRYVAETWVKRHPGITNVMEDTRMLICQKVCD